MQIEYGMDVNNNEASVDGNVRLKSYKYSKNPEFSWC